MGALAVAHGAARDRPQVGLGRAVIDAERPDLRSNPSERQVAGEPGQVVEVSDVGNGLHQVVTRFTVEAEGNEKPVCVADSVGRVLVEDTGTGVQ